MKAIFMIEEPDAIQATMKITMSVKEWTELRDQLANQWPSWDLSMKITDLIAQTAANKQAVDVMKAALHAFENHDGNYKLSKASSKLVDNAIEKLTNALCEIVEEI